MRFEENLDFHILGKSQRFVQFFPHQNIQRDSPFIQIPLAIWHRLATIPSMRQARWLAEWRNSESKPVFYHCISRIVDRRFVLGAREKEKFRTLMRMYEKFSGCRVTSYCLMDNHFHLLLEVPPMPKTNASNTELSNQSQSNAGISNAGLSDTELLQRLSALYNEAFVASVTKELADARQLVKAGLAEESVVVAQIHARFTYRMHDLGEFMKGLLQRYTQWHNRIHERSGRLWEDRFKSVIVEDGIAARTMAAYIDLNPVRAGMVADPAEYRWSSYGEAVGGGPKGNGKKAREGLVRACMSHQGAGFEAEKWKEISRVYRRAMGLALGRKSGKAAVEKGVIRPQLNTAEALEAKENGTVLPDLGMAAMLRCRVRYFTDGAVIGSKAFVNEAFAGARERFSPRRKDGARKLRGHASPASGVLWSARDLRLRV